ncbi:MAG: hypothetical protein GF398_14320 [Chitinivibrionales bacterium]|nr:hypothetical protein [Chitinivibrionales bacterium]
MIKKLFGLSVASVMLVAMFGCDLTDPEENEDSAELTLGDVSVTAITAGNSLDVTGEAKGDPQINSITIAIKDSAGNALSDTKVNYSFSQPGATEKKWDLASDGNLKITTEATACSGKYLLEIKVTAGSATTIKTDTFTVNGVDCAGTAITAKTGTFYNRCGLDAGAFDLVNGTPVSASGDVTTKDLRDTTYTNANCAAFGTSVKIASLNGATFTKVPAAQAAAYTGATTVTDAMINMAVSELSPSATEAEVSEGDVLIIQLGSSRGKAIAIIDTIDPNGKSATTSANTGSISFTYYLTTS